MGKIFLLGILVLSFQSTYANQLPQNLTRKTQCGDCNYNHNPPYGWYKYCDTTVCGVDDVPSNCYVESEGYEECDNHLRESSDGPATFNVAHDH